MIPATIVELGDVAGKPRAKVDLPSPLRNGDRIALRFRLTRQHNGRSEVLDVDGEFAVRSVSFDATSGPPRQKITVEATTVSPVWRAVKKLHPPRRPFGPARAKRTVIE